MARNDAELADAVFGVNLMGGVANVIMQLSHPAVGHGVVESRVDSGNVFKHPVKRARTTYSYLAVATMGSQAEKDAYREAVNVAHRQVRSTEHSPVRYNAFDRDLQLWVAVCLYRWLEDGARLFGQPLDQVGREALFQQAAAMGTTLQVPVEMWPADLAALDKYWDEQLPTKVIDPTVRAYFNRLLDLEMFPRPIRLAGARLHRFAASGYLPQHFRDQLGIRWSGQDQRRWETMMRGIAAVVRPLPRTLRQFPFPVYLWDLRRRIARHGRLV
ncbi:MAG TPA: oxygenase MpaB family protein [Pseudonocardia sp.]|nr:oxygenase MpaB family protein [Pseudonocardia sp.]